MLKWQLTGRSSVIRTDEEETTIKIDSRSSNAILNETGNYNSEIVPIQKGNDIKRYSKTQGQIAENVELTCRDDEHSMYLLYVMLIM
jgi:hypothetical protein